MPFKKGGKNSQHVEGEINKLNWIKNSQNLARPLYSCCTIKIGFWNFIGPYFRISINEMHTIKGPNHVILISDMAYFFNFGTLAYILKFFVTECLLLKHYEEYFIQLLSWGSVHLLNPICNGKWCHWKIDADRQSVWVAVSM